MARVMNANVVVLALAVLAGCGKEEQPQAIPVAAPATRNSNIDFSVTVEGPSQEIKYLAVPTDVGTDYEPKLTWVGNVGKPEDKFKLTKSGLAYKVVSEGMESPPTEIGQNVEVRYRIYHSDMTLIESNYDDEKSQCYKLVLGADTKDTLLFWHEALLGMKRKGEKRLIVPPELAYGKLGRGKIKPDETVVIDIKVNTYYGDSKATQDAKKIAATRPDTQPATIPADLKIEDVKIGDGAVAKRGSHCRVKYVGTLDNGSTFDAGEFYMGVGSGQAIVGFDLGVQGMRVGGIRKVTIPPRLGYGDNPKPKIPANSTLHFEMELLVVE